MCINFYHSGLGNGESENLTSVGIVFLQEPNFTTLSDLRGSVTPFLSSALMLPVMHMSFVDSCGEYMSLWSSATVPFSSCGPLISVFSCEIEHVR